METRASYVIIGTFTLLAIFAGLGFFLWLAKVQIDKTYTQYDILFDQVAGLGQSSPVRFNGVDVGKVLTIALDGNDASKVRVRIEVSATTPVRQGTQATLSSQGVTGVAFVGLDGGTVESPRIPIDIATGVAEIPSKATAVQSLIDNAPDVLRQAKIVLDGVSGFTTPENAGHVTQILANFEDVSGRMAKMMDQLGKASDSLSDAADRFAKFSDQLDGVADNANGAITDARGAISDARGAVADGRGAVADARKTMAEARQGLADLDDFAAKGLPQITILSTQASRLVQDMSKLVASIQSNPARFFLGNRTPEYSR